MATVETSGESSRISHASVSTFDRFLLHNRDTLRRIRGVGRFAARYLLSHTLLTETEARPATRFNNSYLLVSELMSPAFQRVMHFMESFVGAGHFGPQKYWEYPWILGNLGLKPGMKVLDAGCGTAPMQYAMAKLGCDVCGIDPFENVRWHGINRRVAERFNCKIEYRVESMEHISYPDNTFDRVSCASVIEHCRVAPVDNERMSPLTPDDLALQRRMMDQMIRVLKPGGLLVLTTDYNLPRDNCLAESNVNIANLLAVEGAEMYGTRCDEPFPGEEGFTVEALIRNGDIALDTYMGTLQTSIGLTLRKLG